MKRGVKIHCEGFRHEFEIEDFYPGETEVTQGLWKAFMGDNLLITKAVMIIRSRILIPAYELNQLPYEDK